MRIRCLLAMITTVTAALMGCGGNSTTPPSKPFALDGKWIYLGPSDVPHDLAVDDVSMQYTDVEGKWSSKWTIKTYDDDKHHFQVSFDSGSGTYLPTGHDMSGTYEFSDSFLTIQLANGLSSYPDVKNAGTCTDASDGTATPDCRLYVKQN